jgi:hypothetical protein
MWTFDQAKTIVVPNTNKDKTQTVYDIHLGFVDSGLVHWEKYSSMTPPTAEDIKRYVLSSIKVINPIPPNIDISISQSKEQIRPYLIQYIKTNPACTLTELLTYTTETFGWADRALTERMLYEYATNSATMGLITPVSNSPDDMFVPLRDLIADATLEELMLMVG